MFKVIHNNTTLKVLSVALNIFKADNKVIKIGSTDFVLVHLILTSKTSIKTYNWVNIYLFKFNNNNTRKRCEICLKLTIKTPERRPSPHSDIFIVNSEHILHFFLVFLLLTLNNNMLAGITYINAYL